MCTVFVFEVDVGLGEGGEGRFGDGRGEGTGLGGKEAAGGLVGGSEGHGWLYLMEERVEGK